MAKVSNIAGVGSLAGIAIATFASITIIANIEIFASITVIANIAIFASITVIANIAIITIVAYPCRTDTG